MAFRDVVNQDHAILLFRSAVRAGKVGHAYLLVGPKGVGRRTLALAFAQFLNCDRPDGDACGECDPCRRIVSGNHPDVRILDVAHDKFFEAPEKDYRGKEIPIDQIRALRQDAAYAPYQGRRKVYIIADAERLNPNSSNSLLKILEEPPERITFILIAESAVALLPTIVSRCQLVRCTYLRADQIERALVERWKVDEGRAGVISALADGRLGRAREWVDSEERLAARDRLLDLLPALEEGDLLVRLDAAEALVKETQGKEGDLLPQLLDLAVLWYRDLLVWKQLQEPALLVNRDRQSQIARLAVEYGEAMLGARIEAVEAAKESLRRNVNARLALEKLFLSFGPAPVAAP
ncbi:MAG: DNA polymerase III subunit delta' [Armatimonadetes bacterium]|nr:DNA polymerase III subunit delta' [Armatimonadota bacterium]